MLTTQVYYYYHRFVNLADQYRALVTFLIVFILVTGIDIAFHDYFDYCLVVVETFLKWLPPELRQVNMGFSNQYWIYLLTMILGTLVIVISIASQSIPKLIDLYMRDRTSLFFVWYIVIAGSHAILIRLYGNIELERPSSSLLNTHFLIPACVALSLPYIFYILRYTKPVNIINRISRNQRAMIRSLLKQRTYTLLNIPALAERYQLLLFESINQLDDLLEYVSFKEPKADIIQDLTYTLRLFIESKAAINPQFFVVQPETRKDISFKTMVGQFEEMERGKTFYEQKSFRLMGNIFIKLIEDGEFDLASLCVSQLTLIGETAILKADENLMALIIIRFNTYLRFAIKHGVKNNEARNLYTTIFHYGNFVAELVRHHKMDHAKRCFLYFKIYSLEIFKHGRKSSAMYFIVDVIGAEMKKSLMLIHDLHWDLELQKLLLRDFLQIDSPPDLDKADLDKGIMINSGVRVLQIGLALYYLKKQDREFALMIMDDVLGDLDTLGETVFRKVMTTTYNRLRFSGPTFWEDTDRGNLNIYYTPDQAQLDEFKECVDAKIQEMLLKKISAQFQLLPEEAALLWQMAHVDAAQDIHTIIKDPLVFEKAIQLFQDFDQENLILISQLREKLRFNSNNQDLTVVHTRQLAPDTMLDVFYLDLDQQPIWRQTGKIIFNDPIHLYLQFSQITEIPATIAQELLTFQFRNPRYNRVSQFQATIEQRPVNTYFKVQHSTQIKIVYSD